ncbi:MAG: transglycosylase SLT domain-containing protein [Gammaproteobacteria bacterium]
MSGNTVSALTLDEQRKQYQDAKKALRAKKIKTFTTLANGIKDYPLYPYLRYNYIRPRLYKIDAQEIKTFFEQYDDFPFTDYLRTEWLKHLAKKRQWQTFLDNYTPQKDTTLQCYQIQARIKTNNQTYLLEDIRTLWLAGKSQPPQCDSAFALLYKSDLMTNELVWERIRLAMNNGKTGLASYLSRRLDEPDKKWVLRWVAMHNSPDKWTRNPKFDDEPIAREILLHGIKRLVRYNIDKTLVRWEKLQARYDFTSREIAKVDRVIAIRAAKRKHKRAIELLDKIENALIDDEVFHWRLRMALKQYDWFKLRKWTEGSAPFEEIKNRWIYWHARAVEQTGDIDQAQQIYTSIANERDYYGFLAADRIGVAYQMHHNPLPENKEEKKKITKMPGIVRAKELFILDGGYDARREWHHALRSMTSYQMQVAAALASEWGWHDRAILTMSAAHAYDDLELRFPLTFRTIIDANIKKRQLDPGWVYALVRSESAFMEDVKSPAGALGLMQVMPGTGRLTAKRMGLKKFRKSHLLQAEKNVSIGSAYLKQMLDNFNGNMILATAAYNAGPHRVKKWLPKSGCIEPDVWVEKIPFNETRKYVRRVLFFASIYDWRLQQDITLLQQRMATIEAPKKKLLASLECTGQTVSYN